MSSIPDPIRAGLARGWKVLGGGRAPLPGRLACDVVIVGSGAGAGITAELLSAAGLQVVIVEEGPLRSSADFNQLESEAYPQLYQESAARKTADKAIGILQGRSVGGSTTVNWTSSFRTPSATLAWWKQRFELPEMSDEAMAPWFMAAERRLGVGPWLVAPNANNDKLRLGAARLGIPAAAILRNVRGCWNLGSCGLGCPTNAKQSMLVTTIPAALDRGAVLLVQTRAERIETRGDEATGVVCRAVQLNGAPAGDQTTLVSARHVVVAGGAINSPALMLRSRLPDPHGRLGQRTFLHPVVLSTALFDESIHGWQGAPQTMYTDHFLEVAPIDGPMGYKLEAPPLHPVIASSSLAGFGPDQTAAMKDFARTQALLALLRDGFHEQSQGGRVQLGKHGGGVLDYPLTPFVFDGARRSLLSMAEIQFAAGAKTVTPVHEQARPYTSWKEAKAAIDALPMEPYRLRLFSAHVMGGCGMAGKADLGVVRPDGRHWQVANLSVHDGSLFPTSVGANPQLSIYGLATKLATRLAKDLSGRDVALFDA
jgi:choline dehydrogenase-like flavoprotein